MAGMDFFLVDIWGFYLFLEVFFFKVFRFLANSKVLGRS